MKNPFENMGRKVRNTVVGVAALGLTVAGEAKAQNNPQKQNTKIEQVATQKTSWMKETINSAKSELKYVQTKEDAEEFVIKWTKPFYEKIGIFSEGQEDKANYSLDEYIYMKEQFKAFDSLVSSLENKYSFKRGNMIQHIKDRLDYMSSYKNYNQKKRLEKYIQEN